MDDGMDGGLATVGAAFSGLGGDVWDCGGLSAHMGLRLCGLLFSWPFCVPVGHGPGVAGVSGDSPGFASNALTGFSMSAGP